MPSPIPEAVLAETARWMVDFHDYWHDEVPIQIHSASVSPGGTPDWHPDFARWLGIDYYSPKSDQRWLDNADTRVRTTRTFRKLRKKAVREFEVCYRIIVLGERIEETCKWLNERAIRNQIPVSPGHETNYTLHETMLLLVSGVGKMVAWW